jgi:hypothetical protein
MQTIPGSPGDFWEHSFRAGISESGNEPIGTHGIDWAMVGKASPDTGQIALAKEEAWDRTLEAIRRQHRDTGIDLFLSYLFPIQIDESALEEIRSLGIPTCNFFCDNVRLFRRAPQEFRVFDLHWVPEQAALSLYDKARLPRISAAMPTWIDPILRHADCEETGEVAFIGSSCILRKDLLGRAIEAGADITIYGGGWREGEAEPTERQRRQGPRLRNQARFAQEHGIKGLFYKLRHIQEPLDDIFINPTFIRGEVSREEYIRKTRQSTITLGINRFIGFNRSLRNPLSYSRLRDIEAAMLGACLLTESVPGLDSMFEIGEEIETYASVEELVDKIETLSRDARRRKNMRAAAQAHALAEHSVPRTLARIADRLGLAD